MLKALLLEKKAQFREKARAALRQVLSYLQSTDLSVAAKLTEIERLREQIRCTRPDDPAVHGYKVYSQNDEDGIIERIFGRIAGNRTFLEIGVENGWECNTHFLLLNGWRGEWIEGRGDKCKSIERQLGGRQFSSQFRVTQSYVTPENVARLYCDAAGFLAVPELDLFSLDIDGQDLRVLESLLRVGCRPSVICVEYNGKFPPPVRLTVDERLQHWDKNDYYGASLQAFDDLLSQHGYGLITCNITGVNAFYVLRTLAGDLPIVEPAQAWRPLRNDLSPLPAGMRPSLEYLRDTLQRSREPEQLARPNRRRPERPPEYVRNAIGR